jgi:transcriptional regulator with XRE-family HTH domain
MSKFSDWMTKKYIEWRGDTRRTVTDFADYVGVSQQTLSQWLNKDDVVPQAKNVTVLADRFGPEIYEVLGLPVPLYIQEIRAIPQAIRERILAAASEISNAIYGSAIDPESPEALVIATTVMAKYGFKTIDTTQSPPDASLK